MVLFKDLLDICLVSRHHHHRHLEPRLHFSQKAAILQLQHPYLIAIAQARKVEQVHPPPPQYITTQEASWLGNYRNMTTLVLLTFSGHHFRSFETVLPQSVWTYVALIIRFYVIIIEVYIPPKQLPEAPY